MCRLPAAHQLCESSGCFSLVTMESPRASTVLSPRKYLPAPCQVVPRAAYSLLDATAISKAKGQGVHALDHVILLNTPTNQGSAVYLSPGVGWGSWMPGKEATVGGTGCPLPIGPLLGVWPLMPPWATGL